VPTAVDILPTVDGSTTSLRLRVVPGASRAGVAGRHGEAWKVRVATAPERGQANAAVLDLLSEALRVPRRQLEIVRGRAARDKVVQVAGLSPDETDRLLTRAAGGD
jgi:uncharacterized protein (TIGR00251 family)